MIGPAATDPTYKWRGLAAMLVGTFGVTMSLSFLFPASPVIMSDFGVSIEAVAWLSLAYALGASVFEPMWVASAISTAASATRWRGSASSPSAASPRR